VKISVILASHRKNKNTKQAVDFFLEGVGSEHDVEIIDLLKKDVKICLACDYCGEHYGQCVHKDDVLDIISSLKESDLVVLATPLYFNSVSSRFKILIDRTQILYHSIYTFKDPICKEEKDVVLIAVGGSKGYYNQFEGVQIELEHFLKNINGTVRDYFKYNNTDNMEVKDHEGAREELRASAQKHTDR